VLRPLSGPVRDVALLVARVLLGVVLVAHGAQKLFSYGFDAYASVVELVGGGLLILGAATTIVSALVVLDMLGASLTTGSFTSIFVASHGFELEGMILVGALLLLVTGAGRFSIDHLLLSRRGAAVTT
jgi:putative oxidoreductase